VNEIQQIEAAIAQLPAGERQLDSAIKMFREHGRARDRTFIVKWVVILYCCSIGAAIVYLVIRGLAAGENQFTQMAELIKIAVVPMLTLVIGYYFGSEQR
jgi:hypothetical protein